MDTFILAVSTAVLFTLGYGVAWTARVVRRVGLRRFARALGALARAVLVAVVKLFTLDRRLVEESEPKKDNYSWGDAWDDLRIAKKWQRISEVNSKIGQPPEL